SGRRTAYLARRTPLAPSRRLTPHGSGAETLSRGAARPREARRAGLARGLRRTAAVAHGPPPRRGSRVLRRRGCGRTPREKSCLLIEGRTLVPVGGAAG